MHWEGAGVCVVCWEGVGVCVEYCEVLEGLCCVLVRGGSVCWVLGKAGRSIECWEGPIGVCCVLGHGEALSAGPVVCVGHCSINSSSSPPEAILGVS